MAFSLKKHMEEKENPPVHFNTGTFWDLLTGTLLPGYDGKYYLNGGLGPLMYLFHGRTNSYKSSTMDSLLANFLSIYHDIEAPVYDTEQHKLDNLGDESQLDESLQLYSEIANKEGRSRYDRMVMHGGRVSDRIIIAQEDDTDTVLRSLLAINKERKNHIKDLMVETPFINKSGQRIKSYKLLPTIIDSYSALKSSAELETIEKLGLRDPKMRMLWMTDGWEKAILGRAITSMCKDTGMAFICSAHTGKTVDMNASPTAKPTKASQFMKQGEKLKGVGDVNSYGAQVQVECSADLYWDQDKKPYYGFPNEQDANLNEVSVKFQKGKNNLSGGTFKLIATQTDGFLPALTNVHFIRELKVRPPGLNVSGTGGSIFSTCFAPDKKSTRNAIRQNLNESYELRRAWDLLAQITFIRLTYNRAFVPVDIDGLDINDACDKLLSSKSELITDILNSRGYWTYLPDDRPYMSAYDVIDLLNKHK